MTGPGLGLEGVNALLGRSPPAGRNPARSTVTEHPRMRYGTADIGLAADRDLPAKVSFRIQLCRAPRRSQHPRLPPAYHALTARHLPHSGPRIYRAPGPPALESGTSGNAPGAGAPSTPNRGRGSATEVLEPGLTDLVGATKE